MNTLESCHELDFSKVEFHERKLKITHPKTILTGPPKCGKSYLIFDYLCSFKSEEYLYIDFMDMRNKLDEIEINLQNFIKTNGIKVLILENFNFQFEIPNCDSIIITTDKYQEHHGFKNLKIMPLDFEEFLLHDNKNQNITNTFNTFLKFGNLPGIIHFDEIKKVKRLQEIISLYAQNPLQEELLQLLFESVDEKKSLHQLFTLMKKNHKISKDKFYEYCAHFEENNVIFFVEKYNQNKAVKKLYSFNHAFLTTVSHNKKFKNEFANLIFLELVNKYQKIYYLDNIDFYIEEEKTIIFVMPFFNSLFFNSVKKRVNHVLNDLNIKKVEIITVANSENLKIDNIEVQAIPFYEWALLN